MAFGILGASAQTNYVTNPSFENTSANIETQYRERCNGANALWSEGTYCIAADPHSKHSLWASFGDHTTGSGNMMIINGNTQKVDTAWSQTVTGLTKGKAYKFQFFAKSVYPDSTAKLSAFVQGDCLPLKVDTINGTATGFFPNSGTSFTLSSNTSGGWTRILSAFFATDSSVKLYIIDSSLATVGNDFALDDISLMESFTGTELPIHIKNLAGTTTPTGVNLTWNVSNYSNLNLQYSNDGINWKDVFGNFQNGCFQPWAGVENYYRLKIFENIGSEAQYSQTLHFVNKAFKSTDLEYINLNGNRSKIEPNSGFYMVHDNVSGITTKYYKQ